MLNERIAIDLQVRNRRPGQPVWQPNWWFSATNWDAGAHPDGVAGAVAGHSVDRELLPWNWPQEPVKLAG